MKEIGEWMGSGQDYAQGVALYETYGSSQVVLRALRHGASEFTRQKLKSELLKLLAIDVTGDTAPKPVRVVDTLGKRVHETPKSVSIPQKVVSSPQKVASSPEVHAQRQAWFAERNHLHPQLELVATDAERLAMSLRILELGDLISQSYDSAPDSDTTQTSGSQVSKVSAHVSEATDAGEIRRLLANLRPQRSKFKKRPDRALDLAQVELDIHHLEEKLKRDGGESKLHQGYRNGA